MSATRSHMCHMAMCKYRFERRCGRSTSILGMIEEQLSMVLCCAVPRCTPCLLLSAMEAIYGTPRFRPPQSKASSLDARTRAPVI